MNQAMSAFIQNAIVAVAVIFALYSVAKRFAPAPLRRFLRRGAAQLATRLHLTTLAQKLDAKKTSEAASACGNCGGCSPRSPSGKETAVISVHTSGADKTPCSGR